MTEKYQVKSFSMKVDEVDENDGFGVIRGLASTFNNIDLGDDRVMPGAFKRTLKQNHGNVMVLADHMFFDQIGWGIHALETEKGLEVEAEIDLKNQKGLEKYRLAKRALTLKGANMGLSIGYQAVKFDFEELETGEMIRNLKEVKLFEYSLTAMPMNTEAIITDVKTAQGKELFLKQMHEHAIKIGLTMPEMAEWALAQRPARDIDDPNLDVHSLSSQLKGILNNIKTK